MYAVIENGGKQYRVELGQEIAVDRMDVQSGETVEFERVLLVADGASAAIGRPIVAGARVSARVLRQARGDKIVVFKYRPKARRRVKSGARADLTVLRISDIVFDGTSAAKVAEAARTERERLEQAAMEAAAARAEADRALAERLAKAAAEAEAKKKAAESRAAKLARAKAESKAEAEVKPAPGGTARRTAQPTARPTAGAAGKPDAGPRARTQAPQPEAKAPKAKPKPRAKPPASTQKEE